MSLRHYFYKNSIPFKMEPKKRKWEQQSYDEAPLLSKRSRGMGQIQNCNRLELHMELMNVLTILPCVLCNCVVDFIFTPKWIAPVVSFLDALPFATWMDTFKQSISNPHLRPKPFQRLDFHVARMEIQFQELLAATNMEIELASTTDRLPLETLCEHEANFIRPRHVVGTVGSILVMMANLCGPHLGGREILNWNTERQRYPQRKWIPASLHEATLTGLLAYYSIFHRPPASTSCGKVGLIRYGLPWLAGYLYGERGILWMVFVLLNFRRGYDQPNFNHQDIAMWMSYAMYGHTGETYKGCLIILPDEEIRAALRVIREPSLLVPAIHQVISQVLLSCLPKVLVNMVLQYQVKEWVTIVEERIQLDTTLSSLYTSFHRMAQSKPMVPQAKKIKEYLARPRPTLTFIVSNVELCEYESYFLTPFTTDVKLPIFGTLIEKYIEKSRLILLHEQRWGIQRSELLEWSKKRATYSEADNCIPFQLAEASFTALLCYYANYRGTTNIESMYLVISWLAGYLYGESTLHWMLFVLNHIRDSHRDITDTFKKMWTWVYYVLYGSTRQRYAKQTDSIDTLNVVVDSFFSKQVKKNVSIK